MARQNYFDTQNSQASDKTVKHSNRKVKTSTNLNGVANAGLGGSRKFFNVAILLRSFACLLITEMLKMHTQDL